jgi:hypothetical protein
MPPLGDRPCPSPCARFGAVLCFGSCSLSIRGGHASPGGQALPLPLRALRHCILLRQMLSEHKGGPCPRGDGPCPSRGARFGAALGFGSYPLSIRGGHAPPGGRALPLPLSACASAPWPPALLVAGRQPPSGSRADQREGAPRLEQLACQCPTSARAIPYGQPTLDGLGPYDGRILAGSQYTRCKRPSCHGGRQACTVLPKCGLHQARCHVSLARRDLSFRYG